MGEEINNTACRRGRKSASNTSGQKKAVDTAGRDGCSCAGKFQERDGDGGGLADYIGEADLRQ